MEYQYGVKLGSNLEQEQWEESIALVYFMLQQVDPVAKACVPAGEEIIFDS